MKKVNYLLYAFFLIFVVGGVACYLLFVDDGVPNVDETTKDNYKFSVEYTKVPMDNVFIYKTEEEIINFLETGTGIVYLGFPECPWCQSYVVYLNEVAKDSGIEKIYYLNVKDIRTNNTPNYQKIVSLLSDILPNDENGNKKVYVPQVVFVKKGNVVAGDNETSMISDGTPLEYWTSENIANLKQKLVGYINAAGLTYCTSCN
jgi:thiol-disulfide isomerase/thioredoxin